jgi:glyoxylase-like metal-dependent hydrolase (beta-lactamase superfamily II)
MGIKTLSKGLCVIVAATIATIMAFAQNPAPPATGSPQQSGPPAGRGRGRGGDSAYLPTQAQWDSNQRTQQYVADAKAIAGDDPDLQFDFSVFCKASGGATGQDRATIGVPNSTPHMAPFPSPNPPQNIGLYRLFDNFYWIGDSGVGTWLITSSDGYILFDTLNTPEEARDLLIPSMQKAGLDPAKIRYVVFGHWHLDHTGGGQYIQSQYHPAMIMGRDDWDLYFKTMQSGTGMAANLKDKTPMTRGIDATDGMKITVGDVTATIILMTGHTPGSLGMIVPVQYQGEYHPILLVTAATDVHNRESFIGGYEHIWDIAIQDKVESVMQVHPNTNMNLLARMKYVNDEYPPAKNPLLYGSVRTERYINIMRACTQARMEALGW